jgi:hypothetical protein
MGGEQVGVVEFEGVLVSARLVCERRELCSRCECIDGDDGEQFRSALVYHDQSRNTRAIPIPATSIIKCTSIYVVAQEKQDEANDEHGHRPDPKVKEVDDNTRHRAFYV